MARKKLYIIRHGQTDYNLQGIVQGSGIDAPLNATGQEQARRFYEANRHLTFDRVYTSELQRTHQSVAPFLEKGIPHEIVSGLNEISWGIKEGEKVTEVLSDSYYGRLTQSWRDGEVHLAIEGGESPLEVAKRQREAIDLILSRETEKQVLICMHGRAMRILLSQLLETPLHKMDQYEHSNLCLYHLEWDGDQFHLIIANQTV